MVEKLFTLEEIEILKSNPYTASIYRIREYPRIMRKQYSFFHFPSSYTR